MGDMNDPFREYPAAGDWDPKLGPMARVDRAHRRLLLAQACEGEARSLFWLAVNIALDHEVSQADIVRKTGYSREAIRLNRRPAAAATPEPTPDQAPAAPALRAVEPAPAAADQATEAERQEEEREWAERADAERAEFERRLKPVAEFGEGYQMAEWPGTGRYYLVHEGERIGHAVKTTFGTRWEAHTAQGAKVPGSSTYKTRRDALIQVAIHHQATGGRPTKRR